MQALVEANTVKAARADVVKAKAAAHRAAQQRVKHLETELLRLSRSNGAPAYESVLRLASCVPLPSYLSTTAPVHGTVYDVNWGGLPISLQPIG